MSDVAVSISATQVEAKVARQEEARAWRPALMLMLNL